MSGKKSKGIISKIYSKIPMEMWLGIASLLAVLLLQALGLIGRLELSFYDLRSKIKPNPPVTRKVVAVVIDDETEKEIGGRPWRRTVHARVLDSLKRLRARQVVFDIEFTEKSSRTFNKKDFQELSDKISFKMNSVRDDLGRILQDARKGRFGNIALGLGGIQENLKTYNKNIHKLISSSGQNDDLVFSLAIRKKGGVIIPVRGYSEKRTETPLHEYVLNNYGFKPGKKHKTAGLTRHIWLDIPPNPLHRSADRLAFTNVDQEKDFNKDPDGVRRRISLFRIYRGRLFPQLALASILHRFKVKWEDIEIHPGNSIVLNNCTMDGKKSKVRITIPVDEKGQMLINWASPSREQFLKVSYAELFEYFNFRDKILSSWAILDRDLFGGQAGLIPIYNSYQQLLQKQLTGKGFSSQDEQAMAGIRKHLMTQGTNLLFNLKQAIPAEQKALKGLTGAALKKQKAKVAFLEKQYKDLHAQHVSVQKLQKRVGGVIPGATVIIGHTASSTSDLGTTPQETSIPQVFLHVNVFNTIFNRAFIHKSAGLVDFTMLLLVVFLFAFFSHRLQPSRIIVLGFGMIAAYTLCNILLFAFAALWLGYAAVTMGLSLSFIAVTSIRYLKGDKEKKYIKTAFQHYVAAEVVEDLVAGRANLKLGGERKVISAFFSDVQGFSSISEKLKPDELVELLNDYLTDMTDIVMSHKGAVDKFEGDAVIAMYGAPVYYEDHALRACLSCLDQQTRIREKAPEWKKKYGCDFFVRMGVNTGPMVVGNMGSRNRFDYTMMGDAVNLAARLEGVNKYYGTGIMISEFTRKAAGDAVVAREVDKLRVVGKKEAVTVYELVGKAGEVTPEAEEKLELFRDALGLYQKKNWPDARSGFAKVLRKFKDDGPSAMYRDRCAEFIKNPPPKNWDGVYTLKGK